MGNDKMGGGPAVSGVDKTVSQLAMGTAWCTPANEPDCQPVFDAFIELGGTTFDSGRIYGGGESERVLGDWVRRRGLREEVVILTKGATGTGHGIPSADFESVVDSELQTSLEKLRTDYVDIYLLHRDSPEVPIGRLLGKLNELLDAGKARAIGVSNIDYARVEEACEYAEKSGLTPFAALSNNVALAVSAEPFWPGLISIDEQGARWHARTGAPDFSWSSQARGFFTGRYTPEVRERLRSEEVDTFTERMLTCYLTDENFERLRRAQEMGRRKGGYTAVEVALAWVLHRPYPVVPLVGAQNVEELRSCVHATSLSLSADECRWLNLEA